MAKEQIEKVKELLESAKVTAVIQDSVLFGATISLPQVVTLIHQIDEIYSNHEHELLTAHISPDEARKGIEVERNRTLDDMDTLIRKLESFYAGESIEKTVISRVRDEFNNLRKSK